MSSATARVHVDGSSAALLIPVANLQDRQISILDESDGEDAIVATVPISRKEKRKLKKTRHDSALPTPSDTDNETTSPPRKPPNNPSKKQQKKTTDSNNQIPPSMPLAKDALQKAYPLLICSIGNPGATYANTLHSAGHLITSYLSERKGYTPFSKGLAGLTSKPDTTTRSFGIIRGYRKVEGDAPPPEEDWTFWQSTTLMNVSGASVKRAYGEWLRALKTQYASSTIEGRLVIVHDELESALGHVTVRDGGASAKGHNGLKSCQQQLGRLKWWRIGVGIGRPESRDPNVVSKYVLGKMSGSQRTAIEKSAVPVFAALEDIAAGVK